MGWTHYDDVGEVYELSAVYDDALKKDETFTNYAVMVANRILMSLGIKAYATYGKWGARLEPVVNPELNREEISEIANKILAHPTWEALKLSTHVFTYGDYSEEIDEYQSEAQKRAEEASETAHKKVESWFKKP